VPQRPGHVIKLATGLVQEFGALTLQELAQLLSAAGVQRSTDTIAGYMLCAHAAGWTDERRKGSRDFYFARTTQPAAALRFDPRSPLQERLRRRYDIREYWRGHDPDRHRGITGNEGEGQ
jgi:hypothetical protein